MKKIIAILIFSFVLLTAFSQVPTVVHDPTNLAKIKDLLDSANKQLENFKEQTKILKEAQEQLQKVNKEINNLRLIKRAVTQQTKYIEYFSNDLKNVSSTALNEYTLATYLSRIDGYRAQILDNSADILKILSDNVLKMSDFERMQMAREIMDENDIIMAKAQAEKDRYEEHNKQLRMLEELKK